MTCWVTVVTAAHHDTDASIFDGMDDSNWHFIVLSVVSKLEMHKHNFQREQYHTE